jgi:hypothetical protein
MPLLSLLLACRLYSAGNDDEDWGAFTPSCDEAVYQPINLAALDDAAPAEAHANAYGAAPRPFQVTLGWPDADPSRSVSVVWRTDLDTRASVIEWGADGAFAERREGYSYVVGSGTTAFRVHEVKLCGRLSPGTTYQYRVGGPQAWSATHTFTTPGDPSSFDTFRVAIAGDTRGAPEVWGALVRSAEQFAPDIYLFSGDMVNLGTNQQEWDDWFAATGSTFAEKPFLPAAGNHELLSANYFAQFSLPGREIWWEARYGSLQLVSLTDLNVDEDLVVNDQTTFLHATFANNDAPWAVALHHASAYSACTAHGSNELVREAWVPTFEQHDVDLVVNGHNHLYERSVPIRDGAEVGPGEGPVYLVSGGGGAPLYENVRDEWFNAFAEPVEHFVIGDFSPEEATFTAYDLAGNTLDRFTIPAN